ncbi:cysteine proteinase [Marasmius fiardii PR-910]|nr:cysteine proteinase [Marasmius fiardii PR-910]
MPSPYSKSQVLEWLTCIGYDVTPSVQDSVKNDSFPTDLDNLTIIQRLHLLGIKFENTQMHYSSEHTMDVEAQPTFQRLVRERKGSYCFGKTGLLFGMLRGLGYRVYAAQGRVNQNYMKLGAPPEFTPTTHVVLLVQPIADSNVTYMVDVGFGGSCPVRPILLTEGEAVMGTTPTEKHRLRKGKLPDSCLDDPTQWVWKLECLHTKENEPEDESRWRWLYAFDETERFAQDMVCSSHWVATYGTGTIFAHNVLCIKQYWYDEDQLKKPIADRWIGSMSLLGGVVRRHLGPRSEVVKELKSEEERIEAIKEFFEVDVGKENIQYIQGRSAALSN